MREYFRISVEELRRMVDMIENQQKYHSMTGVAYVSVKHHPNGRPILEFEQTCGYAECSSTFYRFDQKDYSA